MILLEKIDLSKDTKVKVDLFKKWVDTGLIKQKEFDHYFQEHHIIHFFTKEFSDYLIEKSKNYGSIEDYITHLIFENKRLKSNKNKKDNSSFTCDGQRGDCSNCKNKC